MARSAADTEQVDIILYRIIYNAIEDVENPMKGMLSPVLHEVCAGPC
jgi:translation initiation factor IF-2